MWNLSPDFNSIQEGIMTLAQQLFRRGLFRLFRGFRPAFLRDFRRMQGTPQARSCAGFPRLEERQNQIAGTLSGGEQQMLAIGRAMMANPDMLLLDEPSMGLSPLLVKEIFKIIKETTLHHTYFSYTFICYGVDWLQANSRNTGNRPQRPLRHTGPAPQG